MERKPRFAAAFEQVVGDRAGVASEEALFAPEPDARAQQQVQRLHLAVSRGYFQVALDELAKRPEQIPSRPLATTLMQYVCEEAVTQRRDGQRRDGAAWLELLQLPVAAAELETALREAGRSAVQPARDWLLTRLCEDGSADTAAFEARVDELVLGELSGPVRGWWDRHATRESAAELLGDTLTSGMDSPQSWVAGPGWPAVMSLVRGLSAHNVPAMREKLRAAWAQQLS